MKIAPAYVFQINNLELQKLFLIFSENSEVFLFGMFFREGKSIQSLKE